MSFKEDELSKCLYFSSNALSRKLTSIADESFRRVGVSPSYAFLLLIVIERPGIQPGEISRELELSPSTVTRHIERLEQRGLLERSSEGRATKVSPTGKGIDMRGQLEEAWKQMKQQYRGLLGDRYSEVLTEMSYKAAQKL